MTEISEEYTKMLRELHNSTHPERGVGEFTAHEYYEANKDKLKNLRQAECELAYLEKTGKLLKPPRRYIGGYMRSVFKFRKYNTDQPH